MKIGLLQRPKNGWRWCGPFLSKYAHFKEWTLLNPDFRDILCALHAEKVEFLVVGSYAVAAYARARGTEDIDIWVRPSVENSQRVMRALLRFGAPTSHLTPEDFQVEGRNFQMGSKPWRIDVLTFVEGISFDETWTDRQEFTLDDVVLPVPSRKHLIANKRAAGRPKDLADVAELEKKPKT